MDVSALEHECPQSTARRRRTQARATPRRAGEASYWWKLYRAAGEKQDKAGHCCVVHLGHSYLPLPISSWPPQITITGCWLQTISEAHSQSPFFISSNNDPSFRYCNGKMGRGGIPNGSLEILSSILIWFLLALGLVGVEHMWDNQLYVEEFLN